MIRDDDPVDAALARLAGVVGVQDALEDDREGRSCPRSQLQALPGELPGWRTTPRKWPTAAPHVLLRRLLEPLDERPGRRGTARSRCPRGTAGRPAGGRAASSPAGSCRPSGRWRSSRPPLRAGRCSRRSRRRSASRAGYQRGPSPFASAISSSAVAEAVLGDHRQADRRRRTSRGELALLVEERLHADREPASPAPASACRARSRERSRVGDVWRSIRGHDPPAAEGLQVRAHRVLAPGAAEDVARSRGRRATHVLAPRAPPMPSAESAARRRASPSRRSRGSSRRTWAGESGRSPSPGL